MRTCIIFGFLVLFFAGYRKITHYREAKGRYLKHETHVGLIQEDQFKAKVGKELPAWMREQIEEDFKPYRERGISKQQVDATFAAIRKKLPEPFYIRYRIVNNTLYRYFPQEEKISLDDNGLEKTLKTLTHYFKMRDADFIVGYIDGVPMPGSPADFYLTGDEKLQAPLLVFARLEGTPHTILIPDWRSVADWWTKDVKTVLSHLDSKP